MTRKPRPAAKPAKKASAHARAKTSAKTSAKAKSAKPKAAGVAGRAVRAMHAAPAPAVDTDLVRALAQMLSETDLTEIEVAKGDLRVRVARFVAGLNAPPAPLAHAAPAPAAHMAHASAPTTAPAPVDDANTLKSPMVGTVYLRPSPDAKPFADVGDTVKAGDKVLLVEAMKTFNEILAHRGGVVSAILIEDGQPVEYGQALLVIE